MFIVWNELRVSKNYLKNCHYDKLEVSVWH